MEVLFSQYQGLLIQNSKEINHLLSLAKVSVGEGGLVVDYEDIKEKLFLKTGLTLCLSNNYKENEKDIQEMIEKKQSPFSTANDHDLLIHVLPTIYCQHDFNEVFQRVGEMKNAQTRAWTFESVFLFGFLRMIPGLSTKDANKFILDSVKIKNIPHYELKVYLKSLSKQAVDELQQEMTQVAKECGDILSSQNL